MVRSGAELFARYAYPPNELGYCGPDDSSVLLRRGGEADGDIAEHARQFEGAWAYLELIAEAARIGDPLDARVVEAYWIGNDLLQLVSPSDVSREVRRRLPAQPGASYFPGAAHHGYQVFAVYPWVGVLARSRGAAQALTILDSCRIRWGDVVSVSDGAASVLCRPLVLADGVLSLGEAAEQTAAVTVDGRSLLTSADGSPASLSVGDHVTMHWDWVCDVVDDSAVAQLQRHTLDQLASANAVLAG